MTVIVVNRPPLLAQGQATSFDQLSVLVRPGDKVTVTPTTGSPFSGRIASLSGSGLKLRVGKELRELQELDVATVRHRRPDSLRNGALWGLGIGAATGMVACGRCHVGPGLVVAGLYGGIGAGIGVGIDALDRRQAGGLQAPRLDHAHHGHAPARQVAQRCERVAAVLARASWTIFRP